MSYTRSYIIGDTETTGLTPEDGCEIVQIAAQSINYWNFEDHKSGKFEIYIKPQRPEKASKDAIRLIGDVWAKANDIGVHPKVALQKFKEYCESVNDEGHAKTLPIFVGHNSGFDVDFISAQMIEYKLIKHKRDLPWATQVIDTLNFGHFIFENDPDMLNAKLDTYLNKLGISRLTRNHDAIEDVELTKQMFVRMMKFFRQVSSNMIINK